MKFVTIIFSLAFFVVGISSGTQGAEYKGDIYDAHAHIPKGFSVAQRRKIYNQAGVKGAGLFVKSFEQSGLQKLRKDLGKNFLFFPDVHKKTKSDYVVKKKRIQRFKNFYETGLLAGLGEIYIHLSFAPFAPDGIKTDITGKDELAYLEIADQSGIPVHIHHENPDKDFETILKRFSNVKFILAHSGYLSPEKLDVLMQNHPNLYADLSLISNRHFGPFTETGVLLSTPPSKAWVALLTKHADRFMVGSDIGSDIERVNMLPLVIDDYRKLLGHLPPDVAVKIAADNFLRIFR